MSDYIINRLLFSLSLQLLQIMNCLQEYRFKITNKARQKHRESYMHQVRKQLVQQRQSEIYPLISPPLETYWQLNHKQISFYLQNITQIIASTDFQVLSEDEHQQVVTDLFYLFYQQDLSCPFLRFKKDQSPFTASLVSLVWKTLEENEIAYWFKFIDPQQLQTLFLSIEPSDWQHQKWITNPKLFDFLVSSCSWCSEASSCLKNLLQQSEFTSLKHVELCLPSISRFLEKSEKADVKQGLMQICFLAIKAYMNVQGRRKEIQALASPLQSIISKDPNMCYSSTMLSQMVDLSEKGIDIVGSPQSLLRITKVIILKVHQQQEQDRLVILNYFFRLLYNHWRICNLSNRKYFLSEEIYKEITKVGLQHNPILSKLIAIRSSQLQ